MALISFKIDYISTKKLEAIAAATGRNVSKIVREAIGRYISKYVPPEELIEVIDDG